MKTHRFDLKFRGRGRVIEVRLHFDSAFLLLVHIGDHLVTSSIRIVWSCLPPTVGLECCPRLLSSAVLD